MGKADSKTFFTISTFLLLEHSFIVKSYGLGGVVTHCIIVIVPVLWFGNWGLGLVKFIESIIMFMYFVEI